MSEGRARCLQLQSYRASSFSLRPKTLEKPRISHRCANYMSRSAAECRLTVLRAAFDNHESTNC